MSETNEARRIDATLVVATVERQSGMARDELAQMFQGKFAALYRDAEGWVERSRAITVPEGGEIGRAVVREARSCRLALKEIRVDADKVRKALKEDSLRRGRAIDGLYNVLKAVVEPEEDRLLEIERHEERRIAAERAALAAERAARLQALGELVPEGVDLSGLDDAEFDAMIVSARERARERAERDLRERLEASRKQREAEAQRKRIEEENRKLRAERAEREAALAEERRAREAAEREARQIREAREREDAEKARVRAEEQRAARRAALAPDAVKLRGFATTLSGMEVPNGMRTSDGEDAARRIRLILEGALGDIAAIIDRLEGGR